MCMDVKVEAKDVPFLFSPKKRKIPVPEWYVSDLQHSSARVESRR